MWRATCVVGVVCAVLAALALLAGCEEAEVVYVWPDAEVDGGTPDLGDLDADPVRHRLRHRQRHHRRPLQAAPRQLLRVHHRRRVGREYDVGRWSDDSLDPRDVPQHEPCGFWHRSYGQVGLFGAFDRNREDFSD